MTSLAGSSERIRSFDLLAGQHDLQALIEDPCQLGPFAFLKQMNSPLCSSRRGFIFSLART